MDDTTDIADRLHSAAIHLLRRVRRDSPPMALSAARSSALSVVVYSGPLTIGQLAEIEQVRSPTMTQIVAHLLHDGLVAREPVGADARRTSVRATAAGIQVITDHRKLRVATLAQRLESLPVADRIVLSRAADLLAQVLDAPHHH